MPRIAREVVDGGVYHILNRGNGRQKVFHRDADYLEFESLLGQLREQYGLALYAYCLMPNHFHLIVRVNQGEALKDGMQWFTTTQVRRYHRRYRSSGHVWQGRYKSFGVENDEHFLTLARYVEGNPVRAGLVETAMDWVWSSHRDRCNLLGTGSEGACPHEAHDQRKGALLAPLPVSFNEDWSAFVDTPLTAKELGQVKKRVDRQTKGLAPQGAFPW